MTRSKDDKDPTRFTPARLYEELYCARGDMENMLKQQVLDLKGDRMSTAHLASNQLRVYVQLSSSFPLQALFRLCYRRLMRLAAPAG